MKQNKNWLGLMDLIADIIVGNAYRFSYVTLEVLVFLFVISRIWYRLAGNIWIRQAWILPLCGARIWSIINNKWINIQKNILLISLTMIYIEHPTVCVDTFFPALRQRSKIIFDASRLIWHWAGTTIARINPRGTSCFVIYKEGTTIWCHLHGPARW